MRLFEFNGVRAPCFQLDLEKEKNSMQKKRLSREEKIIIVVFMLVPCILISLASKLWCLIPTEFCQLTAKTFAPTPFGSQEAEEHFQALGVVKK